jgi:hypothetical protein
VLTYHLAAALDDRGWVVRTARSASMRVAALNLIVLVGVFAAGLAVVAQPFSKSRLARAEQSTLPVGAVAYMRSAHVTGRLFNDYGFGGYLVHELPSAPVFVDGRSDLYGGRFLDEYQRIAAAAPGWDEQLRRARVRTAVVARGSGIDAALRARSEEWRLRYQDGLAAVFTRRPRFAA